MGTGYDSDITGGWGGSTILATTANKGSVSASNTSASWSMYGDTNGGEEENYTRILVYTKNTIDVTDYSAITCNKSRGYIYLLEDMYLTTDATQNWAFAFKNRADYKTSGTTLDISAATGSYHIAIYDEWYQESTKNGSMTSVILE